MKQRILLGMTLIGLLAGGRALGANPPASVAGVRPPQARVKSAREYFATLGQRFHPRATRDLQAVFQFNLTGPNAVTCHVDVNNGTMKIIQGTAAKPDVTLTATSEHYVGLANGEMGGFGAYMDGELKVSGNLTLARRMKRIFPARPPGK